MNKLKVILVIILLLFYIIPNSNVYAANSTMGSLPETGYYTKPFKVSLVIDGHGDKFNAAQATVKLSSNLKIKDLTLGDCNFSYLHTPSIQDPTFEGIIISTYLTKCTVYTLTLIPISKGHGTITLSKTHVKRYGDAAEVLSKTTNGSYTLAAAINPSTVLGTQPENTSQNGLYTLNLGIFKGTTPITNASVTLNTVSSKDTKQATTDKTGTAYYSNLKKGVYDAVVKEGFSKVGETIVNVSGPNHTLTLAINLDTQSTNPLMKMGSLLGALTSNPLLLVGVLTLGIIVGIAIAFLIIKLLEKKRR